MSEKIMEKAKKLITYKAMTFVLIALLGLSVLTNAMPAKERVSNSSLNDAQLINPGHGKLLLALDIELDEIIQLGKVIEVGELIELADIIDLDEIIEVGQVFDLDNIIDINSIIDLNQVFELSEIIEIQEIIEIEDVIEIDDLLEEELTTSLEDENLGSYSHHKSDITV